ncbi:hypothetical protein LEMLEM_LOCUS26736 [Lemmus lemmus]
MGIRRLFSHSENIYRVPSTALSPREKQLTKEANPDLQEEKTRRIAHGSQKKTSYSLETELQTEEDIIFPRNGATNRRRHHIP